MINIQDNNNNKGNRVISPVKREEDRQRRGSLFWLPRLPEPGHTLSLLYIFVLEMVLMNINVIEKLVISRYKDGVVEVRREG